MKELDYEQDVKIDERALDIEWLEQPRLMKRYCSYAAQAERELDLAKLALDVEKATLDQEIRTNPEQFGISKITEPAVSNTIITNNRYQTMMKRWIDAKYEARLAQDAVRSIDQRKTALENLVKLHGMSYFAGPTAPRNLSEEREMRNRSANQKVTMRRR